MLSRAKAAFMFTVIHHFHLPRTVPVLKLQVPHSRKWFSPRQVGRLGLPSGHLFFCIVLPLLHALTAFMHWESTTSEFFSKLPAFQRADSCQYCLLMSSFALDNDLFFSSNSPAHFTSWFILGAQMASNIFQNRNNWRQAWSFFLVSWQQCLKLLISVKVILHKVTC